MLYDEEEEPQEEFVNEFWDVSPSDQISFCSQFIISSEEVMERIRHFTRHISESLQADDLPDVIIEFNRRDSALNSQIDPILGVRVLYDTPIRRGISLIRQPREFAIFFRVLAIVFNTMKRNEYVTKRGIFYQDTTLFQNQRLVNEAIENIACCLEVPRTSLRVIACPQGFVAGPIQWVDDGKVVTDCSTKVHSIPTLVDAIRIQKTSAIAVLVVEKESVFLRLVQSTIVNEVILISGRGVPDYSSRLFLKLMEDSFEIPILGLFDMDPYGIAIFCIYKFGSRMAAYDGMNMACTSLRWLGIRPSEMGRVNKRYLMEMSERDRTMIDRLLTDQQIPSEIIRELEIMRQKNAKAQIEALMTDLQELTDLYLPDRFAHHDWK
jgi:meiotic recombination protein SPO11